MIGTGERKSSAEELERDTVLISGRGGEAAEVLIGCEVQAW